MKNLSVRDNALNIKKYDYANFADQSKNSADDLENHFIISAEDLDAARRAGYDDGYKLAQEELTNEQLKLDRMIINSLEIIKSQFSNIIESQHNFEKEMTHFNAEISCMIAKKIAGNALKEDPSEMLGNFAVDAIKLLTKEKEITITTHPILKNKLEEYLNQAISNIDFEGKLSMKTDESIAEYDCHIAWQNGRIESNRQKIIEMIEQFTKRD